MLKKWIHDWSSIKSLFTLRVFAVVVTGGVVKRSWWLDRDKGKPLAVDDDAAIWMDWAMAIFLGFASRRIVSLSCCRFPLVIRRWDSPFVNVGGWLPSSRAIKWIFRLYYFSYSQSQAIGIRTHTHI